MTAAIFGLVGVLVGALMTGGVDLVLERRRERRAFRRSRRLVAAELHAIWMQLILLHEEGKTPTGISTKNESRFFSTETWAAHRDVLADSLSDDAWAVIPIIFQNAESLRFYLLDLPSGEPLPARQLELIGQGATQAAAMYEYLTGEPVHPEWAGRAVPDA